ncbi:MAG: hypothetical protein ACRDPH_06710 [Marmoricola sp.]
MSTLSRTGAACLLLGPLAGLASVLVARTESLRPADLAAAFTAHPGATHLGYGINAVATVLMAAGLIWVAWRAHDRSPRLAVTGAVLGMLGLFSIMMDDAVHLAGSLVVSGLTPAQATPILHRLTSGGIVTAGVLSELVDIGVILLAVAVSRIGVPRWACAVMATGAVVEGVGFSAGSQYLAAVGFALTFAGIAVVVRTSLVAAPGNLTAPIATQSA